METAATRRRLLLLFLWVAGLRFGFGYTNSQDAAALQSLMSEWQNVPPSWKQSDDPCTYWDGVQCSNGSVTSLRLTSMNLKGTLSSEVGQLTKLVYLDLSSNSELGGPLTPNVGNLTQLTTLDLASCSFTGDIPPEIGSLSQLYFLALNSNNFTGRIPSSIGQLSNLFWLDVGENQLTGPLPVSSGTSPGLDLLVNTQHFHFSNNQLQGNISEKLFSTNMTLIHVLFDNNQISGPIPSSIGLVQSLQIIRLDMNEFSGSVPQSISNLTNLTELYLANNHLTGPVPNLTVLAKLNYVDLSNNSFDSSPAPEWFSTLTSLMVLVMENGQLSGKIPPKLFTLPQLQQVTLDNNDFNGTLDMSSNISSQLMTVNFLNNYFTGLDISPSYNNTLMLKGNPVCSESQYSNGIYCTTQQKPSTTYTTSLASCGSATCPSHQSPSPGTCSCAYPYEGLMTFIAPGFTDLSNSTVFKNLELSLWTQLDLAPQSVYLSDLYLTINKSLVIDVKFFPANATSFSRSDIIRIGGELSNQNYTAPSGFGPYNFHAFQYPFQDSSKKKSSMAAGAIVAIAVACVVLLVALILLGVYAVRQRKIAKEAFERANPFASWGVGGKDDGSAPVLKGAKFFTIEELKRYTNNFSESNEIGVGGYGKVYKGVLPNAQPVAIKRAQQGSMQGALEFKTEIELLSRVHHKNLVGLVGFCYEQGEQMLVYEYIANGTLRENLIGRTGIQLDWSTRLRIALGSARGLAYLHELADPPIIHRDIKSTNILMDESLNAKVADFGLSKLVSDTQKGHVSTQVKGTLGYLDPEYYMTQQLSEKSDVYSFGVVMLELVTSKQPIEKGKYIVREVRTSIDQYDEEHYGLGDIMDPIIKNSVQPVGFRRFVQLAMECVEESASQRPAMNEVVKEIEIILQNEGLNSSKNSMSSLDFGNTKSNPRRLYSDQLPLADESSSGFDSGFDYSGGYTYASRIEPK